MYQEDVVARVESPGLREVWQHQAAVGAWMMSGSITAGAVLASQPFDYLVIDCQHGLGGHRSMEDVLGALGGTRPARLVRVPSGDGGWPGLVLDSGAEGVIVPMVNDADAARRAVAAMKYAPQGERSFGPIRASARVGVDPDMVNAQTLCIVMIESAAGLQHADEICAVPGVDAVYIGPADLAISLGHKPWEQAPEVDAAIVTIRDACARAGVIAGIHATSGRRARDHVEQGFRMVTAVSDIDALRRGSSRELELARGGGR